MQGTILKCAQFELNLLRNWQAVKLIVSEFVTVAEMQMLSYERHLSSTKTCNWKFYADLFIESIHYLRILWKLNSIYHVFNLWTFLLWSSGSGCQRKPEQIGVVQTTNLQTKLNCDIVNDRCQVAMTKIQKVCLTKLFYADSEALRYRNRTWLMSCWHPLVCCLNLKLLSIWLQKN